ncbi:MULTISPECIES: type VI secretion system protein TssA [unclassified Salinicola]|uniref:type VI secretion system protein TssA n=1 Tax=unclassified Salinicola TaxID=2634022 RepID=UPI0004E617EF|nr:MULTISPECIES: type VI secretion system protein TssA [unclassified Salinicola]KFF50742.1 ImpA-like protein [Gammaproteobacteria bacterium MFB021]MCE3027503.1 type VI secretion system protein TssA [Salinicola sp. DM10]WIX34206.1 type VI secretion system protein TssA [Salinicola sp. JS01]
MDQLGELSIEALLAPIEGASHAGGEDLTFSLLFDQIKEARRADPTYLPQGEWQTELKQSDWGQVINLTSEALIAQSKDLQLAGWLCEGLAHREGFDGIAFGLTLEARLLDEYWETLYPELDEDDLEERSARLSWLGDTLIGVVRTLPLLDGDGYGLADYDESRQVENQARNDPDAMDRALSDGKINDEIFQRSVVLTSTDFLQQRHAVIAAALVALEQLDDIGDQRFGRDAPSFAGLQKVLVQCRDLTEKLLRERGADVSASADAEAAAEVKAEEPAATRVEPSLSAPAVAEPAGALRTKPQSRDEAFEMLNGVARYFKEREPHSPVPYLIERAVKWGRMPLEEWLKDVIKDHGVIDNIRDTLGTQPKDDDY